VYVTRREWSKALTELNEVMNGGYGYALFENYYDAFQKRLRMVKSIFSLSSLNQILVQRTASNS
jgi:hypothetical protein